MSEPKKPHKNSYLRKVTLHCSYGSYTSEKAGSDHQMPSSLLQPDRPANSRRAKGARSDSCKLGCEYDMTILQLAQWPWVQVSHVTGADATAASSNVFCE